MDDVKHIGVIDPNTVYTSADLRLPCQLRFLQSGSVFHNSRDKCLCYSFSCLHDETNTVFDLSVDDGELVMYGTLENLFVQNIMHACQRCSIYHRFSPKNSLGGNADKIQPSECL